MKKSTKMSVEIQNKIMNLDSMYIFNENDNISFLKEKIVELNQEKGKLVLEFQNIIVAISKNGGLIALCKKKDYLDLKKSKINDNIIIMHQDASTRYFIPIKTIYEKRYIVSMDFNDKEQLN